MKYKILITERAHRDMNEHVRFLGQVNKPAGLRLKRQFKEEIRMLSDYPLSGPLFDSEEILLPRKYRQIFVENWYIILYHVEDATVYVDYILDTRRGYRFLLK